MLFIDIVGYSKLLINEQRASLDNLGTNYSGTIAGKQIEEAIAKARASAKSALALDPNLAEAHLAQGVVLRAKRLGVRPYYRHCKCLTNTFCKTKTSEPTGSGCSIMSRRLLHPEPNGEQTPNAEGRGDEGGLV